MKRPTRILAAAALATFSSAACRPHALQTDDQASASGASREELVARVLEMQKELQRRHEQIDAMHKVIVKQQEELEAPEAKLGEVREAGVEMEKEFNEARAQLIAVQKQKARLERDLHHSSWIIQRLMERGLFNEIIPGPVPQPTNPISAKVLAVRPEVNLVTLSAGAHDGVKKGYRFTIYRGERYIGKVEVEKTFEDTSSARILADWTKEPIKENDDAATRVVGKPPPGEPHEQGPAAPVDGKVLAVRPEVNLVMLSVGSADGVKKGYRFTIYRGDRYIGKVEVEKVFEDMSSARILTDWAKGAIRENDDASTRVVGKPLDGQADGKKPAAEDGAAGEDAPAEGPREVF